jgi:hypothetical protein
MALARADGERAAKIAQRKPPKAIASRLDDSKALVDFHDADLGEAWARATLARTGQKDLASPDAIARALSLDGHDALRAPCPSHHVDQCWGTRGESLRASDDLVARIDKDLDVLASKGLHVVCVRSVVICANRLNEAAAKGRTRFQLDVEAMERLFLHGREVAGQDVIATCGKVGGYDFYDDQFVELAGRLRVTMCEGRARSEYRFPGLGTVAFVRDADASHTLVSLASLVGKWLRDTLMRRVVQFYRDRHEGELPDASGYHDPVTTKFIHATRLVRERHRVHDTCFERRRATLPNGEIEPTSERPKSSRRRPLAKEPKEAP